MKSKRIFCVSLLVPVIWMACIVSCGENDDGVSSKQNTELIGTWHLTKLMTVSAGESVVYSEEQIRQNGLVWTLCFTGDCSCEQTSNLNGEMATSPGTWKCASTSLTLTQTLSSGGAVSQVYTYSVDNGKLTLNWSAGGTVQIYAEFRRDV